MQQLVFFGSDQYSKIVLEQLLAHDSNRIALVVTDRPKPKGRERIVEPNPVEKVANAHKINIAYYPEKEESQNTIVEQIKKTHVELGVASSFDHLLPATIISLFPQGILNVHPSLLPQYRNVSPVQYAIAMGDTVTGVSIFKISEGIDNGEIVTQAQEQILATDTAPTLSTRLFRRGANILIRYLNDGLTDTQTNNFAKLIFTRRLTRDSGYIEWPVFDKLQRGEPISPTQTANALLLTRLEINPKGSILHDLVRALTPWPGVWTIAPTKKGEQRLSITSANPELAVKLAGKPKPIRWKDFEKYYVQQ